MPVCHLCEEDLPKAEFSGTQLKKKAAERGCSACLAAAEMKAKIDSSPLPAEKVDSAMVLKPVTVEKRRAKTEPTRRHTVATPVRMGSARW